MIEGNLQTFFERKFDDYLSLLKQMVDINSYTINAAGVNSLGDLTVSTFEELGFSSLRYPSKNRFYGDHIVLKKKASNGNRRPTIGLVSHLDTVFPREEERRNGFSWRIEGDKIFGPGTVDIKGGTLIIFMILDAIREFKPLLYDDINWCVLLNAAEETLQPEFGEICRQHIPVSALACLVFEGGRFVENRFSIVTARKGMATYRIEVEGKAAHAGSAHQYGANAIVQLSKTVTEIANLTDYDRRLTFNVGTVTGGTVINRVPHMAVASGEMRAFDTEVLEAGLNELKALERIDPVEKANGEFPCLVRIEIMGKWRSWAPNQRSNNLLSIWDDAAKEMGFGVTSQKRGGLSDGNWLWDYVPTLDGLGPSGGNAHCSERNYDQKKEQEYVLMSSFIPKAILNSKAIVNMTEGLGDNLTE